MNTVKVNSKTISESSWKLDRTIFWEWIKTREIFFSPFEPGFTPEPTMKILIFLALVEGNHILSYEEIHKILLEKQVVTGTIPNNTLRTSALNLKNALDICNHSLMLKSSRGLFQIIKRSSTQETETSLSKDVFFATNSQIDNLYLNNEQYSTNLVPLLLDKSAVNINDIACTIVQKAILPFKALYFLEWSARWLEIFSVQETEMRIPFEIEAWKRLGIRDRLYKSNTANQYISIIGLEPREGLTQIELLRNILETENTKTIHYLAIESSPRLLRDHIGLLKETLTPDIESGRLLCAGVLADIFTNMNEAVDRAKTEFMNRGITSSLDGFLPADSGLLVTLLENRLGNNIPDQESEVFSIIRSVFKNRPLEFLVGVSLKLPIPDHYERTWNHLLLQAPKHLLVTKKVLESLRPTDSQKTPEFQIPLKMEESDRFPEVKPELYAAKHNITGQIYRFYYKLEFDLKLVNHFNQNLQPLPSGNLLLLLNIIKYDIISLIKAIEKEMAFKVSYDQSFHMAINTINGKREYALFSAYLETGA